MNKKNQKKDKKLKKWPKIPMEFLKIQDASKPDERYLNKKETNYDSREKLFVANAKITSSAMKQRNIGNMKKTSYGQYFFYLISHAKSSIFAL